MSENSKDSKSHSKQPVVKREMSRRQFLSYTLGGTGGFLAAGLMVPMVRFAVDPVLQPKKNADWVKVVEESKVTDVPQSFKFSVHQVDGWYESDPELEAWISKDKAGNIFALNPTCKHLGCTVNWEKTEYHCPCHGARYTKEGKNLVVAPLPLDEYSVKIDKGFVYVGQLHANETSKK
ncbi:ubiquinol-cytochrome c reductase iron-sulfur subunit [Paenibacillus aurantius]|uniref:Ubiquinol-cytochrome c reductase iron-sulfur subunit n=1 Tax=Paenibacillus aurantius TaxID=2918900 RepID=A0AA96RDC5_9BACL|nr:ubiquinol-cytochrome c reductase iron-sulfur subunit [Paenibacillus aurantius]WJH34185.1 ubiquinol-cytochrome c reductase iron-sulfur subunit [Paenibacillus sp. CC-CFT747]WNQ09266.1 ubiquinol-cytochrome c reductase iron-sulfur subunit [Paenibacillus aurantius]